MRFLLVALAVGRDSIVRRSKAAVAAEVGDDGYRKKCRFFPCSKEPDGCTRACNSASLLEESTETADSGPFNWATGMPVEVALNALKARPDLLHAAAFEGGESNAELVNTLILAKADLNKRGVGGTADKRTPLMLAVLGGNVDIAKALLEAGANVNLAEHFFNAGYTDKTTEDAKADTALAMACRMGEGDTSTEMINLLLSYNADLKASKPDALAMCKEYGNAAGVRMLEAFAGPSLAELVDVDSLAELGAREEHGAAKECQMCGWFVREPCKSSKTRDGCGICVRGTCTDR